MFKYTLQLSYMLFFVHFLFRTTMYGSCIYVMTVCLQQRFTNEDHLAVHKHKHEMTLRFGPARNDSVIIAGESEKSAVRNKSK